MSVLGQPSVLYLRRSQPPSRYQPSRPCSAILASTSSSVYGLSFSFVSAMRSLHHNAAVDVDGLAGDERGLRRGEIERRGGDVLRPAPASQRGRLRHLAAEVVRGAAREGRLDPPGAQDVDADARRERAGEAAAEREHAALDRAEQLRVRACYAARHVVPAHVHDAPAAGLLAHDGARGVRAGDRALEIDRQQEVELALPLPARRLAGEHVGARVVDPHVEAAEPLARLGGERLAAVAGPQVARGDERARADPPGDGTGGGLAGAVGDEHGGAGGRERLGDRGPDAAARARDDGARALEAGAYPSAPPANG